MFSDSPTFTARGALRLIGWLMFHMHICLLRFTDSSLCLGLSATLWPVHGSPRTGGRMDSSILLIRPLTIEFGIYSDCHSKLSPLRYRLYGPVCTIAITLSCLPLHLLFRIPSAVVLHSVPLTNCKASRIMRTGRRTCAQYCSRSGSGAWGWYDGAASPSGQGQYYA